MGFYFCRQNKRQVFWGEKIVCMWNNINSLGPTQDTKTHTVICGKRVRDPVVNIAKKFLYSRPPALSAGLCLSIVHDQHSGRSVENDNRIYTKLNQFNSWSDGFPVAVDFGELPPQ